MPVLAAEPMVWPEGLLDGEPEVADAPWWVIHTRPRAEKSLSRLLRRDGIAHFLPQHQQVRRVQRRTVRSYLPLFPGYLFLRASEEERSGAVHSPYVASCLRVGDQARLVRELTDIRRLLESGVDLTPETRLQPGTPAEIMSGPLAGCRGRIVRGGRSRLRFVLEVNFLQRGASVEVDATDIQAL